MDVADLLYHQAIQAQKLTGRDWKSSTKLWTLECAHRIEGPVMGYAAGYYRRKVSPWVMGDSGMGLLKRWHARVQQA